MTLCKILFPAICSGECFITMVSNWIHVVIISWFMLQNRKTHSFVTQLQQDANCLLYFSHLSAADKSSEVVPFHYVLQGALILQATSEVWKFFWDVMSLHWSNFCCLLDLMDGAVSCLNFLPKTKIQACRKVCLFLNVFPNKAATLGRKTKTSESFWTKKKPQKPRSRLKQSACITTVHTSQERFLGDFQS